MILLDGITGGWITVGVCFAVVGALVIINKVL